MARPEISARALQLKVTLRGIRPPVWRRVLVPESMTLGDLHHVIQDAFGWLDGHLHDFAVADRRYGNPANTNDVEDESTFALKRLRTRRIKKIVYTYDFGDDWEHLITVEDAPAMDPGRSYPACIAGRRSCPPEDIGGAWGYARFLAYLADPADPEAADMAEFFGEDLEFDPAHFDVAEAQTAIERTFHVRRARR